MLAIFAAFSLQNHVDTAVRATLFDGQVLMGEVRTKLLRLTTGAGTLDIPLADVGEVVPAGDQVGVWLRNGSELRGIWTDPRLAMDIAVGRDKVGVDLPMNELARFQLQGGEAWPTQPVYRMRTTWGDDFLVDPARTQVTIENQLGAFTPSLADCRSVAPIDDPEGDWRIELHTGTILKGRLRDDAVTLALPMGPREVTIPLANFVSLELETWAPVYSAAPPALPALATSATSEVLAAPSRGAASHADSGDWFDNADLQSAKAAQDAE
ncbi:MAG: hypothetical protein FJ102_10945 [Deltaproteobacteria bacterium]|nr:hypothetical protein [Deltaproteobacteria bacterium]